MLTKILNSWGFLIVTLIFSGLVGWRWYDQEQSRYPPTLPGWQWSEHKETLMIVYRLDCGCSLGVQHQTDEALQQGRDVLVVGPMPNKLKKTLRALSGSEQITYIAAPPSEALRRFPKDETLYFLVKNGRFTDFR